MAPEDAVEIAHAVEAFLLRFGEDACHQAAIRAQELQVRGDKEGAEVWHRIEADLRVKLAAHREG